MPSYRISGLIVASEFVLPGAAPLSDEAGPVDVTMRLRATPEALEAPERQTRFWQIRGGRFLLSVPGVGRFLAVDGCEIDMDPAPGTDPADAVPFLIGSGLGAILLQRGALVLHASTVERNGRAYAFCGPSGMGKSTLAAALCKAGCRLVADDVSAVILDDDRAPAITPDGRMLKLFDRTIDRLGLEAQRGEAVRTGVDKRYVAPPGDSTLERAVRVGGIYAMRRQRKDPHVQIERLSPLVAAQILQQQAYRRNLALAYASDGRAMAVMAALVGVAPVHHMAQPDKLSSVSDTAARLIAGWDEAGG